MIADTLRKEGGKNRNEENCTSHQSVQTRQIGLYYLTEDREPASSRCNIFHILDNNHRRLT